MTVEQVIALTGAITALVVAVTACLVQITRTHELVNSRMTELLELTRSSAKAQGVLEGAAEATQQIPPPPTA